MRHTTNRKRKGSKTTRPFMPLPGQKTARHDRIDDAADTLPVDGQAMDAAAGDAGDMPEGAMHQATDIDAIAAERDSYLELARRERADFDNYRKRVQRDMAQMKRTSLASFLKEFFGPLDDLDRVIAESEKTHSFETLIEGVRLTRDNLHKALDKAGVAMIEAKGQPFDPALHEAMTTVPSADVPPNTVLEVYDNGYRLDDFILKPARVVVSRASDA